MSFLTFPQSYAVHVVVSILPQVLILTLISQALDSVRRKRFLFERPPDQPGPSHQTTTTSTCSVCGAQLSTDEETASFHVANCLAESGETNDDSEDGSYEEYTWCNVTRVRATSLLSPQARASKYSQM